LRKVALEKQHGIAVGSRMTRASFVLGFVLITCAGCGPNIVWIKMECPSPTGELVAVYWWEGGGGAAGWAQSFVTILPRGTPVETVERWSRPAVFNFRHAHNLRIKWRTDHAMQIEYPNTAVVEYARNRDFTIKYLSAPGNEWGSFVDGDRCESGGTTIKMAEPKRLRQP
jgi:hypothetical protein